MNDTVEKGNSYTSSSGKIRIYPIETGKVSMNQSLKHKKGFGFFSKINILLTRKFTDYYPIYSWLIEHPEGIFLVDCGSDSSLVSPDYFSKGNLFLRYGNQQFMRFLIKDDENIVYGINQYNIQVGDISCVIPTHLHFDHIEGLKFFPKTKVLVHEKEYKKPYQQLRSRFPEIFEPELFSLLPRENFPFGSYYPITKDGDIFAVPTPGHTYGHIAIIVHVDDIYFMFAGDHTYDEKQLLIHELPGIHAHFREARKTSAQILEFAKNNRVVYLPSHDPEGKNRLKNLAFL